MFSKMMTGRSTKNFCREEELAKLKEAVSSCDAIIIGAGAGLSTSAGFTYSGERFERYFSDFARKYGLTKACVWERCKRGWDANRMKQKSRRRQDNGNNDQRLLQASATDN